MTAFDPKRTMISRRHIIACLGTSALGLRRLSVAQESKQRRIGILEPYAASDSINAIIRQALSYRGFTEGKNLSVTWRHGEGRTDRFPAFAAELARLRLDAIIAIGDPAIRAVRSAAPTTPIIAGSDDLVGEGNIASLAHPGGNVTGVSILAAELNAKRLEVLKQAVPSASRVFVLWDPNTGTFHLSALRAIARELKVELNIAEIRDSRELGRAFEAAGAWRAQALNVLASPLLHALREQIIALAARDRLPAIYQWGESAAAGGLMAYGPTHREVFQEMAAQLERVLQGARPADLPAERPTKFELVINLKTAKTLSLEFPSSFVRLADRLIQ